eukprot:TRINITY_DN32485_c0_g1_i1.p1 TRINITY_DN32485_c0_g1~~TRINITY_DN32485_c0_g1_i1.p1  ORF type:complete len:308 (+),score=104.34 TRINITY_DN32485_c0_g1_i1:205-1128(+)
MSMGENGAFSSSERSTLPALGPTLMPSSPRADAGAAGGRMAEKGEALGGGGSGGRSGKGRRRRAAAEQRLLEQQRWGAAANEEEEEEAAAPPRPPPRRKRCPRPRPQTLLQEEVEAYYEEAGARASASAASSQDRDLDLALALSLSLLPPSPASRVVPVGAARQGSAGALLSHGSSPSSSQLSEASLGSSLDLSYESLVCLEAVRCCAPHAVVEALLLRGGGGKHHPEADVDEHEEEEAEGEGRRGGGSYSEEVCAICQLELRVFEEAAEDLLLLQLPCGHELHEDCGRRWLQHYSKACPVCKCDVC